VKVLAAPDKFKGSLTAFQAADAMRVGAIRARPDVEIDMCPLSDGGDGFVAVILAAAAGERRLTRVMGPNGEPIEVPWALLANGTAVLESAAVIGRAVVREQSGPSALTTYGVGELLLRALDAGAREVVIGLGGTSTIDGGIGMAQALGVRPAGGGGPLKGGDLGALMAVDTSERDPRLADTCVLAVTDVDNPLTGPNGAAHVYGPQKGAQWEEIARLERGLLHLATLCGDRGDHPGDGAAGGLAYGLRMFAGARTVSGSGWVLDFVHFDERAARCDLVLTGEGRLDEQSVRGKVIGAVGRRCKAQGIPVLAIAGSVSLSAQAQAQLGLEGSIGLIGGDQDERFALDHARDLLEQATERLLCEHVGARTRL
jgi:glycerate kinase